MRLAIFSDCVHVQTPEGLSGSDVHIFVRQMEALSNYFSEVHIFCPFIPFEKNIAITVYKNESIHFHPLKKVGGNLIKDKLQLFKQLPVWFKAYKKANSLSDIVYQRFPNNLNIPGFFYFYFTRKNVFATYTGTWDKNNEESITYTFQKFLLKYFFRGPVGVYSNSNNLPAKVFKSFSPSYSIDEWSEEIKSVDSKIKLIQRNGLPHLSLITVGSFIGYKNQQYILDTCLMLKEHKISFHLFMVGDGALRNQYEQFITKHNLQESITLTGKLNYTEVRKLYREANFVVQAPTVEGFGKVPVEGYFHGTLPVINNITLAEYLTQNNTLGYLFDVNDRASLFRTLLHIQQNANEVVERIFASRQFAQQFTLENWAKQYFEQIKKYYSSL